jgi:hypothetical protein
MPDPITDRSGRFATLTEVFEIIGPRRERNCNGHATREPHKRTTLSIVVTVK